MEYTLVQDYKASPASITANWLTQHSFHLFLLGLALYIFLSKDISISLDLQSAGGYHTASGITLRPEPASFHENAAGVLPEKTRGKQTIDQRIPKQKKTGNKYKNLTFILSPTYAERHQVPTSIVVEKLNHVRSYVEQYLPVAEAEKRKYGIPVSITLAQGLLESDAGDSRLARESNNHFGIKCRSKCRGCTCRNYSDDDIYDMFRVFDSAWESFREHSVLLTGKRYRHLLKLEPTDYKNWAHGLKKAGYATDKRYAQKLIQIIDFLELDQYD